MKNSELLKRILNKMPELSDSEHEVKEIDATPDIQLNKKLGIGLPKGKPGKMKVFTFMTKISLGDEENQKITRVTIDDQGSILKVTQSK
ncbi:hypothetical protein JXA84_02705 [candidate division WOR-3 bacterium]|nr:hypothetical protein [candidate division WOR-3 bacterium]